MTRVAFIVPSLGAAEGQGAADLRLLAALAGAGYRIDAWAGNVSPEARALPGVHVHVLPRLPAWQWGNQLLGLAATAARVRRARYDLIHADAAIAGVRADVLVVHTVSARWLALPEHVWREPGARGANEAAATRFKARLELRQARRARAVVANSPMTAEDLAARGVARERITVATFGVDVERFHPPATDQRRAAREAFGIEPAAFVAGFVGPLGPRKGFPLAVEALAGTDAVLLAAGDQRGHHLAEARARSVRIVAPGKVGDVRAVYHAADVLVYPSRYDAFGMAVLEAMACGLPVIVSPETGSSALVADAGIVLERTDPANVRAAIQHIRAHPDRRDEMGARGIEIARKHPWDETGTTLTNLYARLR